MTNDTTKLEQIKLFGKYLLVKPIDLKEITTASGIVLPEKSQPERSELGKVIKTADEVTRVKAGDKVLYIRFAPINTQIELERGRPSNFLIMEERDLVGVFYE